jgi:hypothetical protein
MADTSQIVKDMHVHKPLTRMIMMYTDKKGKRHSSLLKMGNESADALILRTLKWASYEGIEVIFRPA